MIAELPPLSRAQKATLEAIFRYVKREGIMPTFRDIAGEIGVTSTSTVFHHLQNLQMKGYLEYQAAKNRSIRLLVDAPDVVRTLSAAQAEAIQGEWQALAKRYENALKHVLKVKGRKRDPVEAANEAILIAVEALGVKDFKDYLIVEGR